MRALRPMGYYANYLELRSCILVLDVGKLAYLFVPPKGLYNRAGPSLAFYGCLWIGLRIVVGPLTPWYDLTTHWTDEADRLSIAAGLLAFMNAVRRLEAHYLRVPGVTLHKGTYPYPTSYSTSSANSEFQKSRSLRQRLIPKSSVPLIVKFVRRYSAEAHKLLAVQGLATHRGFELSPHFPAAGSWLSWIFRHIHRSVT